MSLSLVVLPAGALAILAFYWWRAHRRRVRARQEHLDTLIRIHLDGMQARHRLVRYQVLAHQAIQDEIRQVRRELQPWRWLPYD